MKNILAKTAAVLLAASLTLGLASCGDSDSSSKAKSNDGDNDTEVSSAAESEETKEITGETKALVTLERVPVTDESGDPNKNYGQLVVTEIEFL